MPVDNELIRISPEEEQDIKDNDPTTIPLDPTAAGWSGEQVRARQAASITATEGSVLSELKEKTDLIADKFNEVDEQMDTRDDDVDLLQSEMDAVETRATNLENGKVNKSGDTITGNLDMDDNDIVNVNIEANSVLINDFDVQDLIDFKEDILDGSERAKKAETTDDGQGNANTAQAIKETVDHVNQDVKDTSTPTFVGVTINDRTLTYQKLVDLDAAKQHADINNANPHGTVANDILVDATAYTAPNEPLNVDADTIQKALNQLYAHNHDQEYIKLSQLGIDSVEGENAITGVATLGTDGKVVVGQLPSYVDDIVEFNTFADLTAATKEVAKIYVVTSDPTPANNTSYRVTASGELVKFDHTSAEWGHVTGHITNQIDIENATFTSTVNEGLVSGTTVKTAINDLDAALKTTNSNVSDIVNGTTDIDFNSGQSQLESDKVEAAIIEVQGNVKKIENGTTDITFAPGASGLTSTEVEAAIIEVQGNVDDVDDKIDNVVNGTTDIDFNAGNSGLQSTEVEAAIIEVQSNASTNSTNIGNIVDGTTDITFDPGNSGLDSSNLEDAIKEIYAEKGQINGIATLDGNGRIPTSQLTINAIEFKGTFGSSSSTTEGDLPTTQVTRGDMYVCDEDNFVSTVASITFNNTDKAIYDGTNWVKNDAQDAVISVNTKTGSITLSAEDIGVNASGFDGELSTNDDTIQKALQTLDEHSHDFSEITNKPTSVSGFGIDDAYTKTELNDGQLDTRYYTETELNDGQLDNRYYTETETNNLLDNKVDVGSIEADDVSYDNTNSSLLASNLQTAVNELDDKLESNITVIRVESFDIVNPDNGDGTFTYKDANEANQTGNIDAQGFYIFDLQNAGYYVNNNLVEVNINDDIHYYTSDGNQFREGTPDNEGISTSVKVKHTFVIGDEVDVKYFQGINIAASAISDGAVTFAKLNAELQDDIEEVRDASSTNAINTIVKRNASNEFQGILDGKFKTPRTIALAGDVTGQAQFDGSSGITIQTVVAKQNFDGGNASSVYSPEDLNIEGGGA